MNHFRKKLGALMWWGLTLLFVRVLSDACCYCCGNNHVIKWVWTQKVVTGSVHTKAGCCRFKHKYIKTLVWPMRRIIISEALSCVWSWRLLILWKTIANCWCWFVNAKSEVCGDIKVWIHASNSAMQHKYWWETQWYSKAV